MTGVKAMARYVERVVAVDAVLTIRRAYTNGAIQTREGPHKYTGVSCDLAGIKLERSPVAPVTSFPARERRLCETVTSMYVVRCEQGPMDVRAPVPSGGSL